MNIVRDTQFCVTNWSELARDKWPTMVACAKLAGPTSWSWPKRITPLSIKCLLRSTETYELPGRAVTVDQDSYLIINEGTEYASHIDSTGDVETASVFIAPETIAEVLESMRSSNDKLLDAAISNKPVNFVERLYPRDDKLVSILTQIHRAANSPAEDIKIQQQVYSLAEHLLLLHDKVNEEIEALRFTKASTREEIYRRLHICRDYMISNLSRSQSLEEIAAIAGFAPHHFLRTFKEVFASTPHQYLTKLRLHKAQSLVRKGNLSVSDICADVGFESISSFSTLYKKTFNRSPLQDRHALDALSTFR